MKSTHAYNKNVISHKFIFGFMINKIKYHLGIMNIPNRNK
ncbi:hypothetical protein GNP67_01525 [Aliivibrio fischeri]|nr:hypothetical protein [Aliivibrio fischeri]